MDNHLLPALPGLRQNGRAKAAVWCGLLLAVVAGVFLAGALVGEEALQINFAAKGLAPSLRYPFGTDWLGRNMLLRTVKGLSLSIAIGTVASAVSALLAAFIGLAAALGPKWLNRAINWLIDLVMAIPHLVLLILISFALGRGLPGLLVGIAATHWPSLARVVRAEVLQIRTGQYIAVSRRLGRGPVWVGLHHLMPHLVPQLVTGFVLLFPHAILHESSLSFLGYGLPPEQPAIGIILAESMKYLTGGMWWLAVFPGVSLVLVVLLFDKLGEGLKTLLSPQGSQL